MTFGGVELLNNPRVRGIAESAQPCPMYWLRGPECDTLADALGQVGDYNWARADQAPWYDPDLPDVSSRFFGVYAYSITGIYDSTRRADVTESTLDGGVIGATRKGSKRVTVRALDNNNLYNFDYPQNPNVQIGEYVQIQGNQLYRLQF